MIAMAVGEGPDLAVISCSLSSLSSRSGKVTDPSAPSRQTMFSTAAWTRTSPSGRRRSFFVISWISAERGAAEREGIARAGRLLADREEGDQRVEPVGDVDRDGDRIGRDSSPCPAGL